MYICLLVNFNQSVYFINEKDVSVMLTVVVTKLLPSTNITVHINVCNGSSIGKSSSDDCGKCVPVVFPVLMIIFS